MIPLSEQILQQKSWQQQIASSFRDPIELLQYLKLTHHSALVSAMADKNFAMRVTRDFADCMQPGDPHDPLLRQVLPRHEETQYDATLNRDPVGDLIAEARPGIIHKYRSRALLITTAACAIHCRYCFRRHFPYQQSTAHSHHLENSLDYLAHNTDINEVILSGGDPLTLSDQQLGKLIKQLESISHLKTLRIHSRLPIILPDRLSDDLQQLLQGCRFKIVLVTHCNHANEISAKVAKALQNFNYAGLTMLNQAVLLNGVNNNIETLVNLSQRLFEVNILPYYLHMPDPVEGSLHFQLNKNACISLHDQMRKHLPGYLLPQLVEDIPGSDCKRPPQ